MYAETVELPLNVLIIDDSEDDYFLIARTVKRNWKNANVRWAGSATKLKALANQFVWDAVICDHSMPDMTSVQAYEWLAKVGCHAPFILCTGWNDPAVGVEAMYAGARDCVPKDQPDRLIPVLQRELSTVHLREEKNRYETIARNAVQCDSTTGLPTRRLFLERLDQQLKSPSRRFGLLLLVDLVGFKRQMQALRSNIDEPAIAAFAEQLKLLFPNALRGRISECEFAVYEPQQENTPLEAREAQLLQLQQSLSNPIFVLGHRIRLETCLGLAIAQVHGTHAQALLDHATSCTRLNKRLNVPTLTLLQTHFHDSARRRQQVEHSLPAAMSQRQLELYYQPFVNTDTMAVMGAEALIRWNHPTLGSISPDEFIHVAEESGLIVSLGEWVIQQACQQIRRLADRGIPVEIAVNCSTPQLLEPDFAETVLRILSIEGVDPGSLEIELTESAALTNFEGTVRVLRLLRSKGVKIALDDFGTVYSSLNYLRQLPVDILKIDKSFVQELGQHEDSAKIVRAIVGMGNSLGLTVHAEGVESESQRQLFSQWQCARIQGFYISKPLTSEQFERWLLEHTHA